MAHVTPAGLAPEHCMRFTFEGTASASAAKAWLFASIPIQALIDIRWVADSVLEDMLRFKGNVLGCGKADELSQIEIGYPQTGICGAFHVNQASQNEALAGVAGVAFWPGRFALLRDSEAAVGDEDQWLLGAGFAGISGCQTRSCKRNLIAAVIDELWSVGSACRLAAILFINDDATTWFMVVRRGGDATKENWTVPRCFHTAAPGECLARFSRGAVRHPRRSICVYSSRDSLPQF